LRNTYALLALSGYALISRRDFSFMGGFLMIGILVGFLAGLILYETGNIIHRGETNYIRNDVFLRACNRRQKEKGPAVPVPD